MAHNPYYDGPGRAPSVAFSRIEVMHLAASVLVLTVAFALVLNDGTTPLERFDVPPVLWVAAFLAVSSGFVLHELAHKVVAQRYQHWAEFRGQFQGLLISLAIAAGLGILFAAPGAVHIFGRVTPKENGIISIVGPGVNFVIASVTMPLALLMDITQPPAYVLGVVAVVNAVLCLFNLLPFGPLDGKKVWRWNKPAYLGLVAAAIGLLVFLVLSGVWAGITTPAG